MRATKHNYEHQITQDSATNPKHFWSYARSKTTIKETITRLKNASGELTENDTETAQKMNKPFNGVFVEEDASHPTPSPDQVFQDPKLTNIDISMEEMKKRLEELNPSKAPGPDRISPVALKACSDLLCVPLHNIICQVPSD